MKLKCLSNPDPEAAVPERADQVLLHHRARALQQRAQAALLQQPGGEVRVRANTELSVGAPETVSQGSNYFSFILI